MQRSVVALLLLGVAFHALCICSIFDIYFVSPVVPGIPSAEYTVSAPAKRVIIFTLDGCRVDKLYKVVAGFPNSLNLNPGDVTAPEANEYSRTPFLGDVMRQRGSWGVSHNHVPSESRPCHVALTAGMYEDPHAVTKNWKQHPVPFDSVFNQSNNAFIFGNRDVAPMLARHAPQAQEEHYSAKEENEMAREDPSLLDVWSFRRIKELFGKGTETRDPELYAKLHQDRLLIYCHFLGTDLSGPKYGAGSREYLDNIAVVDELIEKTEKMVEKYFEYDGKTAYVVNSDHGMDLRGDHGDEDPAKTRTALIAWGAGVQGPVPVEAGHVDNFFIDLATQAKAEIQVRLEAQKVEERLATREWATLLSTQRKDAMQADVAPLISALAGLPYPRNSVGVLPFTYLAKNKYRADAVRANAEQLHHHALRKETLKRASRGWLFFPYSLLHSRAPELSKQIDEALSQINGDEDEVHATSDEAHRRVEILSQELIDISKSAIDYYQKYDWAFLFGSIMLGYTGWAAILAIVFFNWKRFTLRWLLSSVLGTKTGIVAIAMIWWRLIADSPATYFLYAICSIVFWSCVHSHRDQLYAHIKPQQQVADMVRSGIQIGWIFLCLELVVQGYSRREFFSVLLCTLAIWPAVIHASTAELGGNAKVVDAISGKASAWRNMLSPRLYWPATCLLVAVFPCLPAQYGMSVDLVYTGALLLLAFVFLVLRKMLPQNELRTALGYGVPPVLVAVLGIHWTVSAMESKTYSPLLVVILNRSAAVVPLVSLLVRLRSQRSLPARSSAEMKNDDDLECQQSTQCNSDTLIVRLLEVILAFAPAFILLSTSYEMLFYLVLCTVLVSWIQLEEIQTSASTLAKRCEVNRSLLLLLLIQISFFGTSSVKSMTDFKILSARRFLTGPSPTGAQMLVVAKLLIPFIVVGCAFRLVLSIPSAPASSSSLKKETKTRQVSRYIILSVIMSEYLAVRFLFMVSNEGSWKQMGNSIAVFCIGNAQIVLLPIVLGIAWVFVRDISPGPANSKKSKFVEIVVVDKAR